MNALVTVEHRFLRSPDGAVWSTSGVDYPFWLRYRDVFGSVRVVARVLDVPEADPAWGRADGPGVSFAAIPADGSAWQRLVRRGAVRRAVREAFTPGDAVILRVGGELADLLQPRLQAMNYPYAVEVVSDPSQGRPLFRRWRAHRLRGQCAGAAAASYATDAALQRRYPPSDRAVVVGCSDVDLPREAFVDFPRPTRRRSTSATIVSVGDLDRLRQAPDVLVDAVALAVRGGLDLRLVFVGDGSCGPWLRKRADEQGLGDRVRFAGGLPPGAALRRELDQADLFVLPSRQEGLPREMIEAMARALPCLGSTAGGIPELIPDEDQVAPNDARGLADKIHEVVRRPSRIERMSIRNLRKASDYREELLAARRTSFYRRIRDLTLEAAGAARGLAAAAGIAR